MRSFKKQKIHLTFILNRRPSSRSKIRINRYLPLMMSLNLRVGDFQFSIMNVIRRSLSTNIQMTTFARMPSSRCTRMQKTVYLIQLVASRSQNNLPSEIKFCIKSITLKFGTVSPFISLLNTLIIWVMCSIAF